MFNWNWTGLMPVQFWSDVILNPRVDKKGVDLSSGGLMHKNLSSKYRRSWQKKKTSHFLNLNSLLLFFPPAILPQIGFYYFSSSSWAIQGLLTCRGFVGISYRQCVNGSPFRTKIPMHFSISHLDGCAGNSRGYLPLAPTCSFPALES